MLPPYAELHCLTNFSFLRGASHPEELVERAHALGYAALAVTDECSLAGVVRAHLAAKDAGLPLVIGSEFTLADGLQLALYATDRATYGDLAQLVTRGRRNAAKGTYALTRDDVAALAPRCLALWFPPAAQSRKTEPGSVSGSARPRNRETVKTEPGSVFTADARWFADVFPGRAWIAAQLFARAGDRARLDALHALSRASGLPLVAAGDVHMHVRARRALQDTLTAIRLRTPLAACGHALFANGERHLRSRARLATVYPRALTDATLDVVARCAFSLDELRYEYPEELVPAGATPASHLRALVEAGLVRRYGAGAVPADVRELVEHELALIAELEYEPYFLTVEDIVAFARTQGILCQGRGSAANSAVCYALGITEVDPARMSMLFERFISRERNEPPDIDVDFEHQRREEVMQYVYGKYGRDRAALAATLITYRPKSAIRDVGRALGLDLAQVDRLAGVFAWWDGRRVEPARIREAGFDPEHPLIERLVTLTGDLMGFPRHLSQHVGGFVIARGLLERMVPVENAAMADRTVIQGDKDDLDAMGLLKVDCLALGMLSAIRRALDMVARFRGTTLRMQDIPAEDPAVYAMCQRADTVGVFQIESRAQQSMLPRLRPACFYDLVIEVAIVRPGPIQGGMVHPYLRRRQGLEPVTYPNAAVKSVLERTLGVPIFQEQVMQLAIVAAGFSPGEADHLRRSMAAWRRKGGLEKFEQRLVDGMGARGLSESFARQIYQQILGFGEYGFPESHSASFSLLVYVSAWLKRHEPAAFCAALLNSQPMGFYAPSQLVQDARRHGVDVRDADVTISAWDCTLENSEPPAAPSPQPSPLRGEGASSASVGADTRHDPPSARRGEDAASAANAANACQDPPSPHRGEGWGEGPQGAPALRLGLRMIAGLSEDSAQRIVTARAARPFAHVADLAHRARLPRRDLTALAAAGALARLSGHRHAAVWDVAGVERLPPILADATFAEAPPALPAPTEGQDIVADYRALGLTLRRHPLALLRGKLRAQRLVSAADVARTPHGRLARTAGIVVGRQRPDTASGVVFVTLEDETGATNVIVWRDLGDRQRRELLGARLLAVYGRVEREGDVVHLIAGRLVDLSPLLGDLPTRSRDFH
ncbi:MAG: error-prone DNA polymerase [Burkholderiales bacterium]|nr:error-prone DNA polymerase [Burkholderiales bacterium]